MQKEFDQLTFLEPHVPTKSWFDLTLKELNLTQDPGWPDVFGVKLREWLSSHGSRRIPTLSLFSGGGGLDIGFHDAGFDIVEMVEIDVRFSSTLARNAELGSLLNGGNVVCTDIRSYSPPTDMNVEFIIGGPPCQTFSAAGRRAAGVKGTNDPRGTLFEEYVRILKQLKPRGFLFENVYGIVGAEGGEPWKLIQDAFRKAGYAISSRILDAADYGVPQHRERLFIVGRLIDHDAKDFYFPRPTHGPDAIPVKPYYSAGDAVRGIEPNDVSQLKVSGRWKDLLPDIPPGLNYSFYSSEMGHPRPIFAWRSKFSDFLYKADPNLPVRTIKAQGGAFTGPLSWENRHFSSSEMKRLQTFPDSYKISGGRNVQVHQIGNSVPPQVGRILALAVLDQFFGETIPAPVGYLRNNDFLGFRTRKRSLTKHYRDIAAHAIKELYSEIRDEQREAQNSGFHSFSVSSNFLLHSPPKGKTHVYEGKYQTTSNNLNLTIDGGNTKDAGFILRVVPSPQGWNLPINSVEISSFGSKPDDITAAWKYFEYLVKSNFGVDDIVQLNGYYQYASKLTAKLEYMDGEDSSYRKVIRSITSSIGASVQSDAAHLANVWNVTVEEVLPLLRSLKENGFEVRSQHTNPQIASGKYLIPYSFPTLNPKSVQLFKSL